MYIATAYRTKNVCRKYCLGLLKYIFLYSAIFLERIIYNSTNFVRSFWKFSTFCGAESIDDFNRLATLFNSLTLTFYNCGRRLKKSFTASF